MPASRSFFTIWYSLKSRVAEVPIKLKNTKPPSSMSYAYDCRVS